MAKKVYPCINPNPSPIQCSHFPSTFLPLQKSEICLLFAAILFGARLFGTRQELKHPSMSEERLAFLIGRTLN
ncbi:hypothetical protein QQP08_012671 [Theobroma cacao]|nr:hypothetical protein QQP08_012671 [Theobroma cacao]